MVRFLALTAATVAVTGCGGEAKAPTAVATPTASAQTEAADGRPGTARVTIDGFTYLPARVTVRRGGKVRWSNADASNHTVTFSQDGPRDVENLREARKATVTFEKPGRFAYICEFHPGMAGTVVVR